MKWGSFWFEAECHQIFSGFKRVLSAILFFAYLSRLFDLGFFYFEDGLVSSLVLPEVLPGPNRYSIFDLFPGDRVIRVAAIIQLGCLGLMALGFSQRIFSIFAFVLQISFIHRNPTVAYGVDLISNFFLFYICFLSPKKDGSPFQKELESMGYRLAQIQVGIIYLYSGLHKLKSAFWWKGEALWMALGGQYARYDFSWLAAVPGSEFLLSWMTWGVVFWEIFFIALVWVSKTRRWVLLGGAAMHLGIALTLPITFFAVAMVATYMLFLTPGELDLLNNWAAGCKKYFRKCLKS